MDDDTQRMPQLLALLAIGTWLAAHAGSTEAAASIANASQMPIERLTVEQRVVAVRARLKALSPKLDALETAPKFGEQVAQWYNWRNWRNW